MYCLKVFLLLRGGLALVAIVALSTLPVHPAVDVPGWPAPPPASGWAVLVTPWEHADAQWYLRIASQGYGGAATGSAAFFPAYPLLIRALSVIVGGHPLAAATIISHGAFLAGLVVFYRLSEDEFGLATARRSVLYLSLFPTAFFFIAPFSESLFFLLAVLSLYFTRRARWAPAALAGALAAGTRAIGVVLALPLVIEAVRRAREEGEGRIRVRTAVPGLLAALAVPCGTFAYLLFWRATSGDWLVPVTARGGQVRELTYPWETMIDGTRLAFETSGAGSFGYLLLDWLIVVPAVVAALWVARRTALSYAAYTWASILVVLMFAWEPRPLMSIPRFVLPMFPVFWGFARFADRFKAHNVVVVVSAAGLSLTAALFVNSYSIF